MPDILDLYKVLKVRVVKLTRVRVGRNVPRWRANGPRRQKTLNMASVCNLSLLFRPASRL